MVMEVDVFARNGLTGIEVFGFQPLAIGGEHELGARLLGGWAVLQRNKCVGDSARFAYLYVDVAGLKHAIQIRLVRRAGAQSLDRRRLVPKSLQEGIGKLLSVKRLLSEV